MKRIRSLRDAEKQLEILREHIKKTKGSGDNQSNPDEETTEKTTEETTRKKENKQKNKYKKRREQRNAAEELVKIYDMTKKRRRTENLDNSQPLLSSTPLPPLPKPPLNSSNVKPDKIKQQDDEHLSKLQTPPQPSDESNSQTPATDQPITNQAENRKNAPEVRVKQSEMKQPEMKQIEVKKEDKKEEDKKEEEEEDMVEEKDITIIDKTPSSSTGEILQEMDENKKLEECINRIENEIQNYQANQVSFANRDFNRMKTAIMNFYKSFIFRLKTNLNACIKKFKTTHKLNSETEEVKTLKMLVDMYNNWLTDLEGVLTEYQEKYYPIYKLAKELLKLVE